MRGMNRADLTASRMISGSRRPIWMNWSVSDRTPPTSCPGCSRLSESTRPAWPGLEPLVLRDMERVCAMCNHKRECDRDLDAGTAAEHYEDYCLNAPTIDRLGQTATTK